MLFSEPSFLFVFLPLLLAVYYLSPVRARNAILVAASLVFYSLGEYSFLGWLLASIAVNYWIARGIEDNRGTASSKIFLVIGIASDLALLLVFKYSSFICSNVNSLLFALHFHGRTLHFPRLALPLGISFFTFHKISYKVDVYRGISQAKRSPIDLALYILLFPQLIAGPIVRYNEIASELVERHTTSADFAEGIRRFVLGLGKKMIVANTVAVAADKIFAIPGGQLTTGLAWLGIVSYSLQIYFDFSGYSDMAIGLARMFGFHFPENFNYPYVSASVTEFWRRWHMSLSRWFRDYLYISLGGNRRGRLRTYINLLTVFFLCGLWHGASWSFVVWGLFHGSLLVFERIGFGRVLESFPKPLRHIYTLLMVTVGWILFRTGSLSEAWTYLSAMAGFARGNGVEYFAGMFVSTEFIAISAIGFIGSMPVRPALERLTENCRNVLTGPARRAFHASTVFASTAWLGLILVSCAMLMAAKTYDPFIYFRF